MRSRRVNGHALPRERRPLTAEHKRKLSEALKGNLNSAMFGKARKVGEWETPTVLRHMAAQIKEHRLAQDVTLAELAAATGIDEATLCMIERGKGRRKSFNGPYVGTIIKIALALGVRPYELMP
jgi:DNA-binding XRE family transcriptional regulator